MSEDLGVHLLDPDGADPFCLLSLNGNGARAGERKRRWPGELKAGHRHLERSSGFPCVACGTYASPCP